LKVLIAGASGGVGSNLIKVFDEDNNELFLTYKDNKNVIIEPKNATYKIIKCDFTNENDVSGLYNNLDFIDVVINSFGTAKNKLIKKMDLADWKAVIDTNLTSTFLSCKHSQNKLKDHGHIINISSVLASTGAIGASNYVAAKGGIESFTKSFALECLLRNKIYVNCIALGYFNTGMGNKLNQKIEKEVKRKIPIYEFGNPNEISSIVKYIISSRYLIGQTIHLNGGLYI